MYAFFLPIRKMRRSYDEAKGMQLEDEFKRETVGLRTVDEFREKRVKINQLHQQQSPTPKIPSNLDLGKLKVAASRLSFAHEEDNDNGLIDEIKEASKSCRLDVAVSGPLLTTDRSSDDPLPKDPTRQLTCSTRNSSEKRLGKDPTAVTEFLVDDDHDKRVALLAKEYLRQQDLKRSEYMHLGFSYWNGITSRKMAIDIKRGSSVGEFLEAISRKTGDTGVSLLYVKEDMILEHRFVFHDMIEQTTLSRKGAVLFKGDSDWDDRGQVVEKKWYSKHRHIYPASLWE